MEHIEACKLIDPTSALPPSFSSHKLVIRDGGLGDCSTQEERIHISNIATPIEPIIPFPQIPRISPPSATVIPRVEVRR